MPTPDQALDAYVGMWNVTDEERRRELADQALSENAVLLYPTFEAHGRAEAVAACARYHEQSPGVRIEVTSGMELHHGWFRVAWHVVNEDGSNRSDGQTVAELADDGRLRRVIGFHNPLPAPA